MARRKTVAQETVEHEGTSVTVKIMDDGSVYIHSPSNDWAIDNLMKGGPGGTIMLLIRTSRPK